MSTLHMFTALFFVTVISIRACAMGVYGLIVAAMILGTKLSLMM